MRRSIVAIGLMMLVLFAVAIFFSQGDGAYQQTPAPYGDVWEQP